MEKGRTGRGDSERDVGEGFQERIYGSCFSYQCQGKSDRYCQLCLYSGQEGGTERKYGVYSRYEYREVVAEGGPDFPYA